MDISNLELTLEEKQELENIQSDRKYAKNSMWTNICEAAMCTAGVVVFGAVTLGFLSDASRLFPVSEKNYLASAGIYAENYKGDAPLDVLGQMLQTIKAADLESRIQPTTKKANGSISTLIRPGSGKTLEEIDLIEKACLYKPDYSKTKFDEETIKKMDTLYVNNVGRNLKEAAYTIKGNGGALIGAALTSLLTVTLGIGGLLKGVESIEDFQELREYASKEKQLRGKYKKSSQKENYI